MPSPRSGNTQQHRRYTSLLRCTLWFIGCLIVVWFYFSWQLLRIAAHRGQADSTALRDTTTAQSTTTTTADERRYDAHGKQDPTGGAFVHIGKTGGSTLSKLLRNGCPSMIAKPCYHPPQPETIASQQIHSYYHVMDFGLLRQSARGVS